MHARDFFLLVWYIARLEEPDRGSLEEFYNDGEISTGRLNI